MRGELEDGTLAVGTGGDDTDVGGVVDSDDDAGCEDDFLPRNGGVSKKKNYCAELSRERLSLSYETEKKTSSGPVGKKAVHTRSCQC